MSNNESKIVEKIRASYEESKVTKLDELKTLDRRTKRPAQALAYILGSIGTLVLGAGMCLCMPEVIEGYIPIGIAVGLVGILMVSVNPIFYRSHLRARKRRASAEIFRLSGEILGNA